MDQRDIFRLLLIILLLTNNRENEDGDCSFLGSINQILIVLLLINPPRLFDFGRNEERFEERFERETTF